MSDNEVVSWIKTFRKSVPNSNNNLNNFVIDLTNFQVSKNYQFCNAVEKSKTVIKKIIKKYPPPYTLLASGGIDSQAMIYFWKLSKVPFNIIHFKYKDYNIADTDVLLQFIHNQNLESITEIKNFDVLDFINSTKYIEYAKAYHCNSPHMLTYMRLVDHISNGTVLMSGNFIQKNIVGFNYTIYGLQRYANTTRKNFIPFFLQSEPNLAYCMFLLAEKYNSKWYQNQDSKNSEYELFKDTSYDFYIRYSSYKELEIPVQFPPNGKQTGFEKIKEYFDNSKVQSIDMLKYSSFPSKRPFDIIYRYKLFESIGQYSDNVELIHPKIITTND